MTGTAKGTVLSLLREIGEVRRVSCGLVQKHG
jgi:hypothetical protein